MVSAIAAANAYKSQMKLSEGMDDSAASDDNKPSFGKMLEQQFDDVVKTQNAAETAKMQAVTGKGDVTDLVTAVANAELALNTIVTVRDRVISAYQDIIRMPI